MEPEVRIKDKLAELDKVLDGCRTLLIVVHDYPDPDALASAMLLSYLVRKRYDIRTRIVYGGLITRADNRAMVQQLGIKLTHVNKIQWNRYRCIAMVDTQPTFSNHSLPKDFKPMIVIDHHQKIEAMPVAFEDIRTEYGASATILLEYLEAAELELPVDLATAVTYAIRSETQELGRDTSPVDVNMYLKVYPRANKRKLAKINNPKLSKSYFELLHTALQKARVFRYLAHVHLGEVASPEFVPQIADMLLRHERIGWSIATGRYDGQLFVSLRTSHPKANAGKMLKQMIGKMGNAGGHGMIAGGQIPIHTNKDGNWEYLENVIIARFLRKLRSKKDVEWKPLLQRDTPVEL